MPRHELALACDVAEIPRLLDWVESACAEAGAAPDAAFNLALALEEAVVNVIHYAFVDCPAPHRITVLLDAGPDRLAAEIVDNGLPFDPLTAPEPDLAQPLLERDGGGLGIHLIRKMMDRVTYRRVDGCNCLRLEKGPAKDNPAPSQ
jgi:anti-sigma regulatory factor (Ser/Thr protein kinase)